MNEQNLKPFTTSEKRAREQGSKGGKSRSLAKQLANRTLCNRRCPIWLQCWAKPIALTRHETALTEAKKKRMSKKNLKKLRAKCALKEYPARTLERADQILTRGEPGFEQEIMTTMLRLGNNLDSDEFTTDDRAKAKANERFLHQLRECKKSIFGDKKRIQADVTTTGLVAGDLAKLMDEVEEEDEERQERDEDQSAAKPAASVSEGRPDNNKKDSGSQD